MITVHKLIATALVAAVIFSQGEVNGHMRHGRQVRASRTTNAQRRAAQTRVRQNAPVIVRVQAARAQAHAVRQRPQRRLTPAQVAAVRIAQNRLRTRNQQTARSPQRSHAPVLRNQQRVTRPVQRTQAQTTRDIQADYDYALALNLQQRDAQEVQRVERNARPTQVARSNQRPVQPVTRNQTAEEIQADLDYAVGLAMQEHDREEEVRLAHNNAPGQNALDIHLDYEYAQALSHAQDNGEDLSAPHDFFNPGRLIQTGTRQQRVARPSQATPVRRQMNARAQRAQDIRSDYEFARSLQAQETNRPARVAEQRPTRQRNADLVIEGNRLNFGGIEVPQEFMPSGEQLNDSRINQIAQEVSDLALAARIEREASESAAAQEAEDREVALRLQEEDRQQQVPVVQNRTSRQALAQRVLRATPDRTSRQVLAQRVMRATQNRTARQSSRQRVPRATQTRTPNTSGRQPGQDDKCVVCVESTAGLRANNVMTYVPCAECITPVCRECWANYMARGNHRCPTCRGPVRS